jgi:hypothetical protein
MFKQERTTMRTPALACLAVLLLAASPYARSQTAVYCKTETGQLALMAARVVVGAPQTPADLPPAAQLPFRAVSELFRVAQSETTNTYCTPFVRAWVYVSKDAASIDAVSRIAAAATSDTWTAPNVIAVQMSIGRTGNVLNLSGAVSLQFEAFVRRAASACGHCAAQSRAEANVGFQHESGVVRADGRQFRRR